MKTRLENFSIVLYRPRFPENIGSAARAAANMGIPSLIVVAPEDPDPERMFRLATRIGVDIIGAMKMFNTLDEALAGFNHVAGTTARAGGVRCNLRCPKEAASDLARLSENNRIALLFGPEDRGLTNDEIRLCHSLIRIPTTKHSSLNLAQAVMIVCYELFGFDMSGRGPSIPRLAEFSELERMYDRLREILVRIDFISDDNPDYWMMNIRRSFAKSHLTSKDVTTILGICRQVEWKINSHE